MPSLVNLEGKMVSANGKQLSCTWQGGYLTVKNADANKEITTITCADADTLAGGEYFTINGTSAGQYMTHTDAESKDYYFYFVVDEMGNDPRIAGRVGVKVELDSTDTATQVAGKLAEAFNRYTTLKAGYSTATVTVTTSMPADVTDAADIGTGFTFNVTQQGTDPLIYEGTPFPDIRQILDVDIADDGSGKLTVEVKKTIRRPQVPVSWSWKRVEFIKEYRTVPASFFAV